MLIQPKPFLDNFKLRNKSFGKERRRNMSKLILEHGTPFPLSVDYEDIDKEVQKWVEEKLEISYEGRRIPTFKLFSNQRISEYAQTWKHLDENGNILMNFKTITRENNPQQGQSQGGYFNIPGDRMYPMFYVPVLQENGQQAFDLYSMKQPFSVDFNYIISIVTNKYDLINKFNELVQNDFKSLQCYISPNNHPMPLTLQDISDESEYALEDRKYYSQTYTINLKAYIIRKEDYQITRLPSRVVLGFEGNTKKLKQNIKIEEEYIDPCKENIEDDRYIHKNLTITINIPQCEKKSEFIIDTDMVIEEIETNNVYDFTICVNNEEVDFNNDEVKIYNGDNILVMIERDDLFKDASMIIKGFEPNILIDSTKLTESSLDEDVTDEEIDINN